MVSHYRQRIADRLLVRKLAGKGAVPYAHSKRRSARIQSPCQARRHALEMQENFNTNHFNFQVFLL